jgi:glycosyltransferase involved in cell wall biosynthesis
VKILVSAYACEPGKGSEPAVGWNCVRQVATFCETWVITRQNNLCAIQGALAKEPLRDVHFIYFDLPRWAAFWKHGRRGMQLYYYLWQMGAYLKGRKLQQHVGFDLVHHVTFVKYWVPSFLALLPAPFLWGPVGGGDSAPFSFFRTFSWRGKVYESLRHFARSLASLDPFVRLTARRTELGLATTRHTAERLRDLGCRDVLIFSQVGLAEDEIRKLGSIPARRCGPFRILSIGELLHLKGFDLGLRAFARFMRQFPASEYWLIGEGPERKRLAKLAEKLGIDKKVVFWGALPRSQVLEKLAECDMLLHPALHDSGGWVSVEAMAAGRPVICLDLGGPALQVTEETGIRVPATSPDQVVGDLAAAAEQLARDPLRRLRLGQAARERVAQHFSWEKKGEHLDRIYRELTDRVACRLRGSEMSPRVNVR